jgi:hypothetical protein
MAFDVKRLVGPSQLSTSFSTEYTVPLDTTTVVKQIILTNISGSAKTATVRLKPMNVAEANTHEILSNISVGANETVAFSCSIVLENNGSTANSTNSDQLTCYASSNSSVNITIVGTEES